MTRILTDEDIRGRLDATQAITWVREALLAEHEARLVAPPRAHTELGDGRWCSPAGPFRGSGFGYRSYDIFAIQSGEQVVVVRDAVDGRVRGSPSATSSGRDASVRSVGSPRMPSPPCTPGRSRLSAQVGRLVEGPS